MFPVCPACHSSDHAALEGCSSPVAVRMLAARGRLTAARRVQRRIDEKATELQQAAIVPGRAEVV